MSVQKAQMTTVINNICPLVVNTTESILTFQTASSVLSNSDVNAQFSSCNPTDYTYLQVRNSDQINVCCSNTSGVQLTKTTNYGI